MKKIVIGIIYLLFATIIFANDEAIGSAIKGFAVAVQLGILVGIFLFAKFLFKKIFKSKKS